MQDKPKPKKRKVCHGILEDDQEFCAPSKSSSVVKSSCSSAQIRAAFYPKFENEKSDHVGRGNPVRTLFRWRFLTYTKKEETQNHQLLRKPATSDLLFKMGRAKRQMELITNKKARLEAFNKRNKGMLKKAEELKILCDVELCMIIYGPRINDCPVKAEIWPESNLHR